MVITPDELDALDPDEDALDRHRGLRRPRRHRPALLRAPVLPGAGHRGREGLQAAARGAARHEQGRDRARRAALQGVPDGDPARPATCSRWRRCCSPTSWSPADRLDELPDDDVQRDRARARDGAPADRVAGDRVRPDQVPRRVPRARARPDRAQGAGRGRSSVQPEVEEPTEVPDLMAALEASLAAATGWTPQGAGARRPRRRSRAGEEAAGQDSRPRRRPPAKKPRRPAPRSRRPARAPRPSAQRRASARARSGPRTRSSRC